MISLLPAHHETLVLPHQAEVMCKVIAAATSNKPFRQPDESTLSFNGWVKENRFRLSLRGQRANHYLPLVIGQIEATSSGSILFMDYKLFPTTRLLLTGWTVLLILGSLMASYQLKNIFYFLGGGCGIFLLHAIAWSNFRLQLKPTREVFHRLLSAFPSERI